MKTVLCFGDTNTWGVNPVDESRLEFEKRWTGILTEELRGEARVIEEGQCGRTTVCDDPVDLYKNGLPIANIGVDITVPMPGKVVSHAGTHM